MITVYRTPATPEEGSIVYALSATGKLPATHYMASTQFNVEYLDYITSSTGAMATLAQEYGRELPQQEDVAAWCENVIIGEPEGLVRIVEEVDI